MMEITQKDLRVWVEGRDAVINFRAEFCGAPTLETVLGDMENYTEYAEECEALADRVRIASEQTVLAKLLPFVDHKAGCRMRVAMGQSCVCGLVEIKKNLSTALEQKP